MWLDKPEQWEALVLAIRKRGECGLDTETYGQPDKTSPQYRARVHCWSVGVLTDSRNPRGFRRAVGRVLPAAALFHPAVVGLLADPEVCKYAHNAPHDRHALENEGLTVRSMVDSLQWLRVAVPGMRDYGLKGAEQWALGYGPRPTFREMVGYEYPVEVTLKSKKVCICGARPCKKQSKSTWVAPDGSTQQHLRVPIVKTKLVEAALDVTEFEPGNSLPPLVWQGQTYDRWEAWVQYSLADAVRGIELVDWIRNRKPRQLVYPWQARPTASAGSSASADTPVAAVAF